MGLGAPTVMAVATMCLIIPPEVLNPCSSRISALTVRETFLLEVSSGKRKKNSLQNSKTKKLIICALGDITFQQAIFFNQKLFQISTRMRYQTMALIMKRDGLTL